MTARFPLRPMTIAGIMSGTSADGIDVSIVRITPRGEDLKLRLLAHHSVPFAKPLRRAVLAAMDAPSISTAELARLNWRLGQAYAEAVERALKAHSCRLDLVGCHGQTIYHQAAAKLYAGRQVACTWQIGEMAMLAASTRVPVVSNFRPADMVAGGQGAPLVPLLDFTMFRDATRGRVLQNIGGIGNLTAIPPDASLADLVAFDTGPGNMVIDALMASLFGKTYDRGGQIAARGKVLMPVLHAVLAHPFFRSKPPKTAGREQFGAAFVSAFLGQCRTAGGGSEDAVATATALTAHSIHIAYERFVRPLMRDAKVDYYLSGGGSRNKMLTRMLNEQLGTLGCMLRSTDDAGLPAEAKEATAFALLAYQTWHRRPGNVPSATGAHHPAILGDITYA